MTDRPFPHQPHGGASTATKTGLVPGPAYAVRTRDEAVHVTAASREHPHVDTPAVQ